MGKVTHGHLGSRNFSTKPSAIPAAPPITAPSTAAAEILFAVRHASKPQTCSNSACVAGHQDPKGWGVDKPGQMGVGQKQGNPKMGYPGKWKQRLEPAVPWWFNFDHTQMGLQPQSVGPAGAGVGEGWQGKPLGTAPCLRN